MNLYFIAHTHSDQNFDWFVTANSEQDATKLWRSTDYVQDWLGEGANPTYVFLVPAMPDLDQILKGPHCLEWHNEVKKVAP